MTFENALKERLENNGMFPSQAEAVMELVKAGEGNESMAGRWNDDVEGYPPQMLAVLWLTTKAYAVQWIDANLPLAWYRPMFV